MLIFVSFATIAILTVYHFKSKAIEGLKNKLKKDGCECIDLSWQPGPFKYNNNDYLLTYYDKKGDLHESKVQIDVFGYWIINDQIVKEEPAAVKKINPEPKVLSLKKIETEHGELIIWQTSADIEVGNKIFKNGVPLKSGKYKLGFMHYIYVKDGKIC